MRYIKTYENFDIEVSSNPVKDLTWIKSLIDNYISGQNLNCETMIESDGVENFIICQNNINRLEIYHNNQDNDFFLVRIFRNGEMIQDFKRSQSIDDGISPDELASEDVLMYIPLYFGNNQ